MQSVKSSNLKEVGYEERSSRLRIVFHNNVAYIYTDVPKGTFNALISAESVGEFFTKHIRSKFPYTKE
jgi:hypothetical protein